MLYFYWRFSGGLSHSFYGLWYFWTVSRRMSRNPWGGKIAGRAIRTSVREARRISDPFSPPHYLCRNLPAAQSIHEPFSRSSATQRNSGSVWSSDWLWTLQTLKKKIFREIIISYTRLLRIAPFVGVFIGWYTINLNSQDRNLNVLHCTYLNSLEFLKKSSS